MSDVDENPAENTLEQLRNKHKQEKKDLKDKTLAMKKAAKSGNKQKQKETTADIERLEKEMINRHNEEISQLDAAQLKDEVSVKSAPPDEPCESGYFYKEVKISAKNKKKSAKKDENIRRFNEALLEDRQKYGSTMKAAEINAVNKILEERSLQLVDIQPDGDCLYNSIAHQLSCIKGQDQVSGQDMRRRAGKYISLHKDEFLPFLSTENGDTLDEFAFEEYCGNVTRSASDGGVWGGEPELNALSRSLERKIEVIQPEGRVIVFGEEFSIKPLVVVYHRHAYHLGEHYNSTEPKTLGACQ